MPVGITLTRVPPPPDSRSDPQLLADYAAGDVSAFEALYHRHRDWVARLARRFTNHDTDALDVMQETFAWLIRRAAAIELRVAMTSLLYPVVRNLSIKAAQRRRRMITPDPDADLIAPVATPEPDTADLAALVECLPQPQREVLLMRFVDDMPLDAIAAALDIPVGTVKSRLHNALRTLRDDPRTRRYFDG